MKMVCVRPRLVSLALCASATAALVAAPPPPTPPGFPDFVGELSRSYAENRASDYLRLFADNVTVVEDGKPAGHGVAAIRAMFDDSKRRNYRLLPAVAATGGKEILLMEQVSDLPVQPAEGVIQDCCFWYRVVKYTIDDGHKIGRVEILTARYTSQLKTYGPAIPQK